jgi:tRNA threonylcarbamoyl adenosine modification protein (Sua5/YciO/YrdC/YwlC family)
MNKYVINSVADLDHLSEVGEVIENDGVIAYPTDTIYGLGCNPLSEKAVTKIYDIKGREKKNPLIILLDSSSRLSEWVHVIPGLALPLIMKWPAQLTIIFKVKPGLPEFLTCGQDTLAFRVPASNLCRKIVAAAGGSLTSTSVNKSGEDALNDADSIEKAFASELDVLIEGPILKASSSTIIRCVGQKFKVLRSGAYPMRRILRILKDAEEELS